MGCFCFEWNGSKIQRKTLAYLFGIKGSQRHSTGVICLIHQSKVITSILERSKSLLIRQKSQWPVGSMSLLHCLHGIFSSHSPSLQELQKTGASIWMIPEALTQFSIPFTWGGETKTETNKKQTTKDVRLRSKDGVNTCFDHLSPSAQLHCEHSTTTQKSVVVF